ncbi:DUF368 domain-containing protein [Xanthovirga aplysinae]|uniref:DUF368 domain-containing protein n=1 Tax=Xanthovirga aplysinae TaxID=2529853 RepID=UPI0012BC4A62|nr:DUF368 domain-containing protein [Xanthovirga aplysinae]MTI31158.1 DUF368 domain-containing protein [Xanthovirga aplysinae]
MKIRKNLLLFLKGIGMGGADVVPGVSGGTIALITGIYEELLSSIKSIDIQAFQLLLKFRIAELWKHINGTFLLTLFAGIFFSLVTLSKLVVMAMEHFPIQLWSFFFGLIIISAFMVAKEIKGWHFSTYLAFALGTIIAWLITSAAPSHTPDTEIFTFLAGLIAICAMILPGISGSFILVIMGKYEHIVNALNNMDIIKLLTFAAGCVVGLLSFSRLVSWLLNRYHKLTIAVLSGFMLGSLNKIWPWKETVSYYMDRHGIQKPLEQVNISPAAYLDSSGQHPYLLQAILFMALGIGLVVGIELLAKSSSKGTLKKESA